MILGLSVTIFILGVFLFIQVQETARLSARLMDALGQNDELVVKLIKAYEDVTEQAIGRKEALEENTKLIEDAIHLKRALNIERNKSVN